MEMSDADSRGKYDDMITDIICPFTRFMEILADSLAKITHTNKVPVKAPYIEYTRNSLHESSWCLRPAREPHQASS